MMTGSFGSVIRLHKEKPLSEQLALKVVRPAETSHSDAYRPEVECLRVLGSHPHIVTVHGAFCDAVHGYIAMEAAHGDLHQLLRAAGCLSDHTLVGIAVQIASALLHIHSFGYAHRDIKPENILICGDGVAKVCDFNLSVRSDSISIAGTALYAAPELYSESADMDWCAADAWSLGMTLAYSNTLCHIFERAHSSDPTFEHVRRMEIFYGTPVCYALMIEAGRSKHRTLFVHADVYSVVSSLLTIDAKTRLTLTECLSQFCRIRGYNGSLVVDQ